MAEHGPSEKAVARSAFVAYRDNLATEERATSVAERLLAAAHDPALGLDRSVCLADVSDLLTEMGLPVAAARVVRAFTKSSSPDREGAE